MIVHYKHHPFSHPLSVTAERSSCTGHHLSVGFICSDIFRKFEFARQNFSATSSYAKSVWHHTHLVKRFSFVCPFSARTSLPTEKGTNWSMIHTGYFWLIIFLALDPFGYLSVNGFYFLPSQEHEAKELHELFFSGGTSVAVSCWWVNKLSKRIILLIMKKWKFSDLLQGFYTVCFSCVFSFLSLHLLQWSASTQIVTWLINSQNVIVTRIKLLWLVIASMMSSLNTGFGHTVSQNLHTHFN